MTFGQVRGETGGRGVEGGGGPVHVTEPSCSVESAHLRRGGGEVDLVDCRHAQMADFAQDGIRGRSWSFGQVSDPHTVVVPMCLEQGAFLAFLSLACPCMGKAPSSPKRSSQGFE